MSRSYMAISDRNQKQSKASFRRYFREPDELEDDEPTEPKPDLEFELLEDCGPMREEFRRLAQKMRNMNTVH